MGALAHLRNVVSSKLLPIESVTTGLSVSVMASMEQ
jgi:hypothetical protein